MRVIGGSDTQEPESGEAALPEPLEFRYVKRPWPHDFMKGYDFQLFPAEHMRWLATPEARWARPKVSLDEFLAAARGATSASR